MSTTNERTNQITETTTPKENSSVRVNEERGRNQLEAGASSSNRFNSPQGGPSVPPRRIILPNCAKCKKTPTEPHAVYCCGSMYCHTCLVDKMTTSVERGAQVTCDSCGKAMGEAPGQSKNLRGDAAAAASSSSFDQPAAKRPRQNLPYSGGNLTSDSQFSQNIMQNRFGGALMTVSSTASSTNQQYLGPRHYSSPIPAFGFQQPNSLNGPFQNRPPNPLLSNPPSLPSQTSSMGSIYTPTSMIGQSMESLPSNASYPGAMQGSFSSIPQNTKNAFITNPLINIGPPQPMNQQPHPTSGPLSSGGPLPNFENSLALVDRKPVMTQKIPERLGETGATAAQMAKSVAMINEMDEILPIPPHPFEAEERKLNHLKELEDKKAKPEPKEEVLVGTTCTICWNGSKVPVQIKCCKKVFCRECLVISLKVKLRCPSCNQVFGNEDIFNLFIVMKIPEPVKPIPSLETVVAKVDMGKVLEKFSGLDEFTLSNFIQELSTLREQKYKESKNHALRTLSVGLGDFIKKCKFEMSSIQRQMEAAVQDKKFIDGGYARECSLYGGKISAVSSSNSTASSGMMPSMEDPISLEKDERLKSHFDAFCSNYYDIFNKYTIYSNEEPNNISLNRINSMMDFSEGMTKYGKLEKVASLNYDCEPNPSMSIISSLEFDMTGERFVVAGVTRKIKIFNFNYFFENPKKPQIPLVQLLCRAKISNISWNPVKNEILASSDYDGQVSLWDIEAGQVVRNFQEHEKRCWTVNFNNVDPKIMASGSDDAKVKIWNTNCERAMANIDAKVNVCCVYFSPTERNHLVFGSADHGVHLYDIRNVARPMTTFRGHRKAVSYVRFINPTTIVSASTDSSLRVWDTVEGRCVKVLKGHTNEKNFVGLSSNGDHILCGSENSRAFLYYKGLSDPIASYTVSREENKNDEDAEGFVSSVCWKKGTDYALAANSHGRVHLLHVN